MRDFKIRRIYRKGEILFSENTPSLGLYSIRSGTVKIYAKDSGGKEIILKLARAGDMIGYGHFMGEKIHMDSAKAIEDTECEFINSSELKLLIVEDPEFAESLFSILGHELKGFQKKCKDLIRKNVRERLACYFDYMAKNHSEVKDGKIKIRVQLSREEIASIIGTASETAIRFISEFKEMGLIVEEDKYFHILKPNELVLIGREQI
jgi:CRP-like cAMP-binding protein